MHTAKRGKSKRFLSMLLACCMVLAIIPASTGMSAFIMVADAASVVSATGAADVISETGAADVISATGAAGVVSETGAAGVGDDSLSAYAVADKTVTITEGMTEAAIEKAIQDAADAAEEAGGGTVTVIGRKTNVSTRIVLSIMRDVKIVWKAEYTGIIDASNINYNLMISMSCAGIFDVAAGGIIDAVFPNDSSTTLYNSDHGDIVISGGTVSGRGYEVIAIEDSHGKVKIKSGEVSAYGVVCETIFTYRGKILISGGTVLASGVSCITLDNYYGSGIEVSGGSVLAFGNLCTAIWVIDSNIVVSGGVVYADINGGKNTCYAINVHEGTAVVRGGSVSAIDSASANLGGCYAIYIINGAAAYLEGTCTGYCFVIYNGWIAKVNAGWSGTDDSELVFAADYGNYTSFKWLPETDILYIKDDSDSYRISWENAVYSTSDIATIEYIIDNNGLKWPKASDSGVILDDEWMSSNWPDVYWGDIIFPIQRIVEINISNYGLFGSLDLTSLTELVYLNCNYNKLTGLNLEGLVNLRDIECQNNKLEMLFLTGLNSLLYINCNENNLDSLDLTGLSALDTLQCDGNNLTELNLDGLSSFFFLDCSANLLTKLVVKDCVALQSIYCNDNMIETLAGLPSTLVRLYCQNNRLVSIDVTAINALRILDCRYNYMNSDSEVIGAADLPYFPIIGWDSNRFRFSPQHSAGYIPVLKVVDLPTIIEAGGTLSLSGTVLPAYATNNVIADWVLVDAGGTGSTLVGNILTAGNPGTVELYAVIKDGYADGEELEWRFEIDIVAAVPPPAPDAVIDIAAIGGVNPPVAGAAPVAAITATEQYTGAVTWAPPHAAFEYDTIYEATITLTPAPSYTLTGVGANFFVVAGAVAANAADSGVITALFPATGGAGTTNPGTGTDGDGNGGSSSGSNGGGGGTTFFTVKFDLNGGEWTGGGAHMQSVVSGGSAVAPIAEREGYAFDGWDKPLAGISGNTTITAKWVKEGEGDRDGNGEDESDRDGAFTTTTELGIWDNPFGDVNESDWFYGDVGYAYANGLMRGTSTDPMLFSPDMTTTRAMIVTILYRLESEPDVSGLTNPFNDVATGEWYGNAVIWAATEGIVSGYGDGLFGPDDNITRQDLARILVRYADYADVTLPELREYAAFADEATIADYAQDAVEQLYVAGIINGKPGSLFDPTGEATRAEVAAMLHRFLEA